MASKARFYLLLAIVMTMLDLTNKRSKILIYSCLMLLVVAVYLARKTVPVDLINGTSVELYFHLFVAGMAACLLASNIMPNQIGIVSGVLGIGVLVAIPPSSDAMVGSVWHYLSLIPAGASLNG